MESGWDYVYMYTINQATHASTNNLQDELGYILIEKVNRNPMLQHEQNTKYINNKTFIVQQAHCYIFCCHT